MPQFTENQIWLQPKPSRAERRIPRKSYSTFVGELTFGEEHGQGQTVAFESLLEHNVCLIAIYRPDVIDVREQVKVTYTKANGRTGNHFFDFVVTEKGSRKTALIVKPFYKTARFVFRDTVSRIAAAAAPSVVDRVVVVTERMVEAERLARVEQFHSCRFAQPEIDAELAHVVKRFDGMSTIRDFLERNGLGRDGFHAVIRMVRFNILEAIDPGMLTMSSYIQSSRSI